VLPVSAWRAVLTSMSSPTCTVRGVERAPAPPFSQVRRRRNFTRLWVKSITTLALQSKREHASISLPAELPAVTFAADGCAMAHWRNISLVVWGTQATMPLAEEFEKLATQLYESHRVTSTVHLVIHNAPIPTPDARALLEALTERFTSRLVCHATMVQGTGFRASTMRSFLTGVALIQRRKFKAKTFANIHDLATWLAPAHSAGSGEACDAEELERVLAWMLNLPNVK
jgi:hypothetical protein